jgi:hypothetical protein
MFEQWKVAYRDFSDEEQATPNWSEESPAEECVFALGGLEACKLLIPRYVEEWAILRRQEGGSWQCMESVGGVEEELYMLLMEDMESLES